MDYAVISNSNTNYWLSLCSKCPSFALTRRLRRCLTAVSETRWSSSSVRITQFIDVLCRPSPALLAHACIQVRAVFWKPIKRGRNEVYSPFLRALPRILRDKGSQQAYSNWLVNFATSHAALSRAGNIYVEKHQRNNVLPFGARGSVITPLYRAVASIWATLRALSI